MPGRSKQPQSLRTPIAIRVGDAVRALRTQRSISQEELAELASLSKNYIGNIERGEYEVTVSALKQVATALGCRAADLLDAADV